MQHLPRSSSDVAEKISLRTELVESTRTCLSTSSVRGIPRAVNATSVVAVSVVMAGVTDVTVAAVTSVYDATTDSVTPLNVCAYQYRDIISFPCN